MLCRHCWFMTERDDIILIYKTGYCACLRCYHRITDSIKEMPKQLRREIESCLAEV